MINKIKNRDFGDDLNMYCCKTEKGYISDYYYGKYGIEVKESGCEEQLLFTQDIKQAHLFNSNQTPYQYVFDKLDKEKIKIDIPNTLKIFCMKEWLGDKQDKTKLNEFERQYLTKFIDMATWIENSVKVHLWDNNFCFKLKNSTHFNGSWKQMANDFLQDYYYDIYELTETE